MWAGRVAEWRYAVVKERCGAQRVLRELRWPRLAAGTSMLRTAAAAIAGSGVAGSHPCPFSSGPRASRYCGQRSCDQLSAKVAADCDNVQCRRAPHEAEANKHGALALKLGAQTLNGRGREAGAGRSWGGRSWAVGGRLRVGANGGASFGWRCWRRCDFGANGGASFGWRCWRRHSLGANREAVVKKPWPLKATSDTDLKG